MVALVASKTPDEIATLRDEIERLRAQVSELEASPMSEEALDILRSENERLRAELETERIRLAACGVVALSNTPESAEKVRKMLPEYRSASCDDVARMVDQQMDLRVQLAASEARAERYQVALEWIASMPHTPDAHIVARVMLAGWIEHDPVLSADEP